MNPKTFAADLKTFLADNFNPIRADKEKKYLYSDLKHYGLSSGLRRDYLRKHSKTLKSLSKPQTLALVKQLWNQPSFEEKITGLEILVIHTHSLDKLDLPFIESLIRESKGWALLDSFVIQIMPHILETEPSTYQLLKTWIGDPDFWVRRSALLSQLLFFRRGQGGDKQLFLTMAISQFDESWIDEVYKDKLENKRAKFFIRKAIGWTLREMSHKDPQSVYDFLVQHKHQMSGLSYREGSRKLPEDMKTKLAKQF